jgi:hypothetical protein
LLLASSISIAAVYAIIHGTEILPWVHSTVIDFIVATSLGLAITSSFYTSFYRGLFLKVLNPFSDHRSVVSEAAIAQIVTLFLFGINKISAGVTFTALVALQTLSSYCAFSHAIESFRINEKHARVIPWALSGLIAGYGFIVWPTHNFWSVDSMIASTAIWQSIVHVLLIPGITMWYATNPRLKLVPTSIIQSIKLRLTPNDRLPSFWILSFIAALVHLSISLLIWSLIKSSEHNYSLSTVAAAQFLFVPALLDAWSKLDYAGTEQKSMRALARFTPKSTVKAFHRYGLARENWAATIGLRTSAFTVDYDPGALIASRIPATLNILRHEEVLSIMNQLIHRQAIALNSMSHRVVGILDPEHCVRPCVEALNLCATLHLDANALIERRLSSLAALFPLVNPGLAEHVDVKMLSPLLKKSQWFFYFDFAWVDQNIINTNNAARSGVNFDPISEEARLEIIAYMRRSHSVGNFLWIGKDAHSRLLQEAPNLAPIMEAHSFKLTSGSELLLFAIKFEQLVPRLQRYYSLEDLRAKIIDYEPSAEAQRLLKILSIQVDNTTSLKEQHRIIESISSYDWRGYKEKDQALKLLGKIYETTRLKSSESFGDSDPIHVALCRAVSTIGYPSQLMNQAQMFKLELRSMPQLRKHALNPGSLRFEESWILLGHMDYGRFATEDITEVRKIIAEACLKPDIMQFKMVTSKMVDAIIGLLRRDQNTSNKTPDQERNGPNDDDHLAPERKLLLKITQKMIAAKCDAETMSLVLDAFTFIEQFTGRPPTLSDDIIAYFDHHTNPAHDVSGETSKEWQQSLRHRWQEYKSRFAHQIVHKAG